MKKLTIKNLAYFLGVSESTILRWESGKMSPSIDMLILVCNILEVTPNDLLKTPLQ